MGLDNVKVMYAAAPRGVRVTIPLIQTGSYDVADITARLKSAGVTDSELPFVVFSPTPPAPLLRDAVAGTPVPGIERAALDSPDPPIPTAPDANTLPPMESAFGTLSKATVTPTWRQITGCRYSMRRADNQGYVAVQDLPPESFQDPEDYHRVNDGRIKLCYGLVWRRVAAHFLRQNDKWTDSVQSKHGMSSTTSVSVTASVGYGGGGASASISATFGYSVTVSSETTVTIEVSAIGRPGESQTAVLWELCRKYVVEVDGVLRDESNPFTIVYNDKGGPHQLVDTWGPNYEIVSDQPTLKTYIFPN